MKYKNKLLLASVSSVILIASGAIFAAGKLNKVEPSHLTFMREEEKLARDVYLTFAQMYLHQVFNELPTCPSRHIPIEYAISSCHIMLPIPKEEVDTILGR